MKNECNLTTIRPIYLDVNQGHGNARRISVDKCSNEFVALMDADDISFPYRFISQMDLFLKNEKLDVCGGHITEFECEEDNIKGRRQVKVTDSDIKKDLKKRCPMNQVTIMFKKSSYYSSGGYIDFFCEEDYYLWARMIQNQCVFGNVDFDIVNVRTGLEMSSRRGGYKYFKSEKRMQKYLLSKKIIGVIRYFYNITIRFFGEVIAPNWLRNKLFGLTRKKTNLIDVKRYVNETRDFSKYPSFSVAMCVYGKDNPIWFDRALKSIVIDQILKPSEVVLVIDGPIPRSIQEVIDKYINITKQNDF